MAPGDRQQRRGGGRGWHAFTVQAPEHNNTASATSTRASHNVPPPQYVSTNGTTAAHIDPRRSDEFPRMGGSSQLPPTHPDSSGRSQLAHTAKVFTPNAAPVLPQASQRLSSNNKQSYRQSQSAASSFWHTASGDHSQGDQHQSVPQQPRPHGLSIIAGAQNKVAAKNLAVSAAAADSLADKLRAAELHGRDSSGEGRTNSSSDGDWQDVAAAQLESLYPWAGKGLVRAVLSAVDYDLSAAPLILSDMAASEWDPSGGSTTHSPVSSPVATPNTSQNVFPTRNEYASKDSSQRSGERSRKDARRRGQERGGEPGGRHTGSERNRGHDGRGRQRGGGIERTAPPEVRHPLQSSEPYEDDAEPEEVYTQHRREALRLTRLWQRGMHRAAASFMAGDPAAAHRLASDARRVRSDALVAHEEAASNILHANNAGTGRGLWEVDLHGLHASEAVAALDYRLKEVQGKALPGGQRRELRVVVGRGRHSSGGEASLPRAVESYLMDSNLRYQQRGGSFIVVLSNSRSG